MQILARSTPDTMEVMKGGTRVNVGRQLVKVALSSGDRERLFNVVMLLDRESGAHWWLFQRTESRAPSFEVFGLPFVVYFTDQAAVGFRFIYKRLAVREVVGHQPDFAGVERLALADLRDTMLADDWSRSFINVDVGDQIREFWQRSGRRQRASTSAATPKVAAVTQTDNLWHVALKHVNKDFAEIVLDRRYDLKSITFRPED